MSPQSLLQPAPFRTPFFAQDGQIHEEWRRFFLSSQALVNLLLQQIIAGTPHPSLVSAEDSDPSDPFIVPGPTGPAGGAGPPGKPGFDGEDGVALFEPMLHGPGLLPWLAGNFTVISSTATGAQNNFAPALSGNTVITLTGAAPAFTGLAGGVVGQIVVFKNTGTGIATFAHNSGSSSAGNRFFNVATSAATPVAAGGYLAYVYDGTQWQLIWHEQGAWITSAFSAGNFTGSGAMTWTVTAGEVSELQWHLATSTLNVLFQLNGTTVGGTLSSGLLISNAATGGFTQNGGLSLALFARDNGVRTTGYIAIGTTFLQLTRSDEAAWSAATTNTDLFGSAICSVG